MEEVKKEGKKKEDNQEEKETKKECGFVLRFCLFLNTKSIIFY